MTGPFKHIKEIVIMVDIVKAPAKERDKAQ